MDTSLNGKKTAVVEQEAMKGFDTDVVIVKTPEVQEEVKAPQQESKARKPKGLILGVLGVGAIASGVFGYRYWQYASSH